MLFGMDHPAVEQLRRLAMWHYVLAAFTGCLTLLGVLYVAAGLLLMKAAELPSEFAGLVGEIKRQLPPNEDPVALGIVCLIVGVFVCVLCIVHAAVVAYIGRCIARRRRRLLVVIFSVFHLINVPFGTALGILALVVLRRPAVKAAYHQ